VRVQPAERVLHNVLGRGPVTEHHHGQPGEPQHVHPVQVDDRFSASSGQSSEPGKPTMPPEGMFMYQRHRSASLVA
jgi:hypothetical protein